MSRTRRAFPADAFRKVLGFTFRHWAKQPGRAAFIALLVLGATLAEAFSPIFAGRQLLLQPGKRQVGGAAICFKCGEIRRRS